MTAAALIGARLQKVGPASVLGRVNVELCAEKMKIDNLFKGNYNVIIKDIKRNYESTNRENR
jgi:hypothetical protein